MPENLIREYYRRFNSRCFAKAAALFADGAVLDMPPFVLGNTGAEGYRQFIEAWLGAFPDAQFSVVHVDRRTDTLYDVHLTATGTHKGSLDLGTYGVLPPSGVRLTLRMRELLDIRERVITSTNLSFDIHHLVGELTQIDYAKLMAQLATVCALSEELAHAQGDLERQRDVTDRLGRALDDARRIIRPHFNR